MDSTRFDRWTRLLSDPASRRRLLAGSLAALGLSWGQTALAAECIDIGRRCRPGDRCCDGECKGGKCRCLNDRDCPRSRFCERGKCRNKRVVDRPCDEDNQCKTGVCDRYGGVCLTNRFGCDPSQSGQCKGGQCCPDSNDELPGGRCVYRNATPRRGEGGLSGCGPSCDENEERACGAPSLCRNGVCCCPQGVEDECLSGQPTCDE